MRPSRFIVMMVASLALLLALAGSSTAQTFTTLVDFNWNNGATPYYITSLAQGTGGNLYGTTSMGGEGDGTVFSLTPAGALTTVSSPGDLPYAGLVLAADGNFYGTTEIGGTGYGTIFKITPSGTLTMLYSFCARIICVDGKFPYAPLIQATDGNFYGATTDGGTGSYGTVFKVTPGGAFTTLHSFVGTDGQLPNALVQGIDGNFYGTTAYGGSGSNSRCSGCGTIFKITPAGTLTTLHSFNFIDGSTPSAALIQARDGNFYGTAPLGGLNNCGTVFKITPEGTLTILHAFDGADGEFSLAPLVQGTDGNFYGTTLDGGANYDGTIFEMTRGGTLTTLHTFDGSDGDQVFGGLVQATNGTFYGTTTSGGTEGYGTVFSLAVGLGPFVKTVLPTGKVGAIISILGTNLTGASAVTFNGFPATFTVVSPSLIKATVPGGATNGPIA